MSEFNPTEEDSVNLERSIIDLKSKKAAIVSRKMVKTLDTANTKELLSNPHIELDEFKNQSAIRIIQKAELQEIEAQIKEVNLEIGNKRKLLISIQSHLKTTSNSLKADENLTNGIIELRDKYSDFAGDHTRVSSMRLMASNFTDELNNIINQ